MTDPIDTLALHWSRENYPHGDPVVPSDLSAFEARYDVVLSKELKDYFLRLNGSESGSGGPFDQDYLSFWHLDQIGPLSEQTSYLDLPDARTWFVFADYLLWSHAYVVRLNGSAYAPEPIAVVYGTSLVHVAASFGDFVTSYVKRDLNVLFPPMPASQS